MTKNWLQYFCQTTRLKFLAKMGEKRVASVEPDAPAKKPRLPKRKVALQIGYCGTGYHGMQLNAPHKTIEGDIFEALGKAGAISEDNADDPKKSSFLRAARTDKGVHAAGNVVSLKMIIEDPDIVQKINDNLPEQIRVWGYTRTNRSFECRKVCSSRVYEYILPTYTLMPPSPSSVLGKVMKEQTDRLNGDDPVVKESREFWEAARRDFEQAREVNADVKETDPEAKDSEQSSATEEAKLLTKVHNKARRSYRVSKERLEIFRQALKAYEGVHDFHNFTVGKHFKEASATRIMKSLNVSEPFVINGTEWVSVKIHGQSFMLHQIRKMIAVAVLLTRTHSPISKIEGLYQDVKIPIPKAPALGLLLERPVYDAYNKKLSQFGHEAISFDRFAEQIDAFKHKFIYDRIYKQEAEENEFHAFFGYMDTYMQHAILNYLLDGNYKTEESAKFNENDLESESDAQNEEAEG